MTIVALMCAVAFQMNAQTTNVEKLQKEIEQKVKQADKHPKDGKMQLKAALAILNDSLDEKRDLDRALTYANRALKIAQEHPAPQDTLLGLTCEALSIIYMGKQDMEKSMDFSEKAMDAFEVELGRLDPVTNGNKLIYGMMMLMSSQPSRSFSKIMEAIYDNERAPQDKRIQNMGEATIALELALEMLISDQVQRYRYALPMIYIDGKKYYILETGFWNMERPIVGWIAKEMMASDAKDDAAKDDVVKDDDTILLGEDGEFKVLPEADEDERKLMFNFHYNKLERNILTFNDGDARILSLDQDTYNDILAKYRDFKSKK